MHLVATEWCILCTAGVYIQLVRGGGGGAAFPGTIASRIRRQALLMHLRLKASAPEASRELVEDVAAVAQAWAAIRRRFRRRRVRAPRQLLIGHSFGLVPETMSRNPEWPLPLRRALKAVDVTQLFHILDRGEGAQEVAVHQALISDVIQGLRQREGPVGHLFADDRWGFCAQLCPQTKLAGSPEQEGLPVQHGKRVYWPH